MATTDDAKRERLKAALRENLKRRKAQARERAADSGLASASDDRPPPARDEG